MPTDNFMNTHMKAPYDELDFATPSLALLEIPSSRSGRGYTRRELFAYLFVFSKLPPITIKTSTNAASRRELYTAEPLIVHASVLHAEDGSQRDLASLCTC